MVRVPDYEPNVSLRPIFRQGLESSATPQAFGSDIGAGMQTLAKGADNLGDSIAKVQHLEDETIARQRRNQFMVAKDQLAHGDDGYLNSSGKTAVTGLDQYRKDLEQLRLDHATGLTTAQQLLFGKAADAIVTDAQRAGIAHRGKALKAFVVEEGTAGAENFKQQAIGAYRDQALFDKYVAAGLTEIQGLSDKLGWPAEKLTREQQDYVSDTRRRTASIIAQDDPIAAAEYIAKNRDALTPADYLTAMKELLPQTSGAVTRDAVTTRAGNRSRAQFAAAGLPPEAYQLLGVISGTEAPDYDVMNGGQRFTGYADHPRTVGAGGTSTAAGRYQFVKGTWDRTAKALNLPDFSPASQDFGAWWLAQQDYRTRTGRDLSADVKAGNFAQVRAGLADTWEGIEKLNDSDFAARMTAAGGQSPEIAPKYSARVEGLLNTMPANYAARLREAADNGVAVAESERATAFKAHRIAVAEDYKLRIATDDAALSRQEVLDDPVLDKGDKASLIASLESKRLEIRATQEALTAFQAGTMAVDPFSDDGKKVVDRVWNSIAAKVEPEKRLATVEELVRQSGVVPEKVAHSIRAGLASSNLNTVASAAAIASRLNAVNPAALERRTGGREILDAAISYQHLVNTVGLPPAAAAQRLVDARDPEKVKNRAALMASEPIKDFVEKQATESNVRDVFDRGLFHLDPKLGETPATSAAMVDEYKGILKESLFDTAGDQELAKKLAAARFQRRYAVSEFSIGGPSVVVRFPVELTYPADANGSRDYVKDQARAALSAAGVSADKVFLQPYEVTERDHIAGRPARYQVWYQGANGVVERYHLPFSATAPTKDEVAAAAKAKAERQRNINRDAADVSRELAGTAADPALTFPR